MDISEWKKYLCMRKVSVLPSKLSVLEPFLIVFHFGLFNEASILPIFSKIIHLSKWTFQNGKNIFACKKSASYLQNYPF